MLASLRNKSVSELVKEASTLSKVKALQDSITQNEKAQADLADTKITAKQLDLDLRIIP